MGVDLTLMPLMSKEIDRLPLSRELIEIERRRELWDDINALPQKPLEKLGCYKAYDKEGNTCYGDATETPYGEPITYTTAGDLLSLSDHPAVQDNWKNIAVWAYLEKIPRDWPVALYWH